MGSNMQLNGMSNDYVLILIDGKRMNGDIGGQNDLQMINPDKVGPHRNSERRFVIALWL